MPMNLELNIDQLLAQYRLPKAYAAQCDVCGRIGSLGTKAAAIETATMHSADTGHTVRAATIRAGGKRRQALRRSPRRTRGYKWTRTVFGGRTFYRRGNQEILVVAKGKMFGLRVWRHTKYMGDTANGVGTYYSLKEAKNKASEFKIEPWSYYSGGKQ